MSIEKLNTDQDVLLSIMSAMLVNKDLYGNILQFIDNSKDKTLKENEVILGTKENNFKISVSKYKKENTEEHHEFNNEKYIQTLENVLIFMCQTYEEQEKILFELAKEGNDALYKLPRIQGSLNLNALFQISKLEFEQPSLDLNIIKDVLIRKIKNK